MTPVQARPAAHSLAAVTPADLVAVEDLATETGLPAVLAKVLWTRGIRTREDALAFLHPAAAALHDPYCMAGMRAAVDRLRAALIHREPILIYGDYDVDGTVATVLLKTALERAAVSLGVPADVRYHIPHRIREGYGMRESRLTAAADEGIRLVVSVDTGIRAFAASEEAARLGLDLIVTDHHLPDSVGGIPHAVAVLNPNQPGCGYPCKDLCGAAVSFKLAQAILESTARDEAELSRVREKTLPSFLKLLAIATVADAVPLTGENRVIAALGLEALRQPAQSGLRSLMELAGIDLSRPITATDVGFRIGPRVNAAGRMDVASDVVEMFLARDPAIARSLAEKLHALNDDRRATEASALQEIETRLEALAQSQEGLPSCLVLDDTPTSPWHRGVIGILASRVVDRTGRPALVLTHENGEAHGSGRSVPGFHLLDALTAAHTKAPDPLFLRFGGHAHAAGFALPSHRVDDLRARMDQIAAASALGDAAASQDCDAELTLGELTPAFFDAYDRMAPFGNGNPEPLFLLRDVRLCAPVKVLKDRHLALQLAQGDSRTWRAKAWSRRTNWVERARAEAWQPGTRFDTVCRLSRNWHPDFGGWELEILGIQPGSEPGQAHRKES
jgi:single-stranded-DNA-specific exonuclease